MAVSKPGMTRRQHQLHSRPRQRQHLMRLIVDLAAYQQRLGVSRRRGSSLQARRNRQRHRVFRYLAPPQPWSWCSGERFWWGLRWFGVGMAVAILARL